MGYSNQGLQKTCIVLGSIVVIVGIIGSIVLAWNRGVTVTYSSYSGVRTERSILLTILWFLCGIFGTAVVSIILFALGEALERLEMLSAVMTETESKLNVIEKKNSESDDITYNGSWKCTKCGRVNSSYVGTCACGQGKNG